MNNSEIYVSLDIGTSSVKVIIGEMTNHSLNIIGVGTANSEGIRKGSIVDIDKTVHSIRRAVEQAERMIGMQISQVIVGIAGNQVGLQHCHGVVAVSSENREITDEDVARVIDAAEVVSIPPEREIINIIPHQFIVDGLDEITDPRGMIGVRLEMEGIIVTGSKTNLHNTLRCVERAGLEIVDIVLKPLAVASAALSKDEQNLGTALIDMGGGSTTIALFEHGYIKGTTVIPIGGDNITKDLSIGLRTTTEDAEKIKKKHGHAYYDEASEDEVFSVPIIGSDQHQQFNQLELSDIIEARVQEIFELVQSELVRMGASDLPGGIVLTGGAVNVPGIMELAQGIFQNRIRIAIPDYIGVREPQYITAVGLIKHAYKTARLEGRNISSTSESYEQTEPAKVTHTKKPEKNSDEKITAKVKKFFGNFFE
ncbi:cell division protein FtsA [Bacillus sp. J14TS2]|uniref:cell division protein FtsA n=1 Tax=Bacillus sp. J14TS2 TaxID=2807188 RepID=UPI001B059A6C|nr:cell division protein FtsA [Bacillus sp. J14TS2]GIN74367.1 cell division protein FtsA [Bacillus sp. J14TS2]